MKIEVVGARHLVTSVEVSKDDVANQLHIVINTRERWAPHQLSGGWNLFGALVPPGAAPPHHRIVAISETSKDETEPGAEVVFLPENDDERALLNGVAYEGWEKDQIAYLIVPLTCDSVRRLRPLRRLTV
jgi:hypothetical protein